MRDAKNPRFASLGGNPSLRLLALVLLLGQTALSSAAEEALFAEHFRGGLADGWTWLREDSTHWRLGAQGLEVMIQPGNMWGRANNAKNILLRPAPDPDRAPLEITATFHNQPTGQWEQMNLVWFYDEGHMVKLGQELVSGKLCVVMGREEDDKTRTVGLVPLDAHTVQLRLLVTGARIHGQYRTANWPAWREVGDCDLPVKGPPKISLQCYNGPPELPHWARIEQITVRLLATAPLRLEASRASERPWKSGQPPVAALALPSGQPFFNLESFAADPAQPGGKSDAEQSVFTQHDGTYGWTWDRRTIATEQPNRLGVAMASHAASGLIFPLKVSAIQSLGAELDVLSRLDVDRGQHNLCLQMRMSDSPVAGQGRQHQLNLWFDWQGKDSTNADVHDGLRHYGYAPGTPATVGEIHQHLYRLAGFRGAPPRVNLKVFLEDAAQRLQMNPATLHLWRLKLGNEVWNNSKGRTVVRRLDWILNGRRCVTVPAAGGDR